MYSQKLTDEERRKAAAEDASNVTPIKRPEGFDVAANHAVPASDVTRRLVRQHLEQQARRNEDAFRVAIVRSGVLGVFIALVACSIAGAIVLTFSR